MKRFRSKDYIAPKKDIDYWKRAREDWLNGFGKKIRLGDLL